MNEQLPPIDSEIRSQLARRSDGGMPEDLRARISTALDGTAEVAGRGTGRGTRLAWPGVTWTGPRLAGSAVAVVFVAIVAVALGLPALRSGPAGQYAGYPAQRALTIAELAEVLTGPALPVDTALVASVTIDRNMDVCPMNRYATVGVIEGMASQVCVMGANVSAYMSVEKMSGVFAFRYLAPGYLGLLGQLSPASSQLAYRVAEDWPRDGSAFLVQGHLGFTPVACGNETASATALDPLDPAGEDPCSWDWLSDDGSAAPVQSFATWAPGSSTGAQPSVDLLALTGRSRHVEAGGARAIEGTWGLDQLPSGAYAVEGEKLAKFGVWVVKPVTGPCPGAAPYSSVGCAAWRVLALVRGLPVEALPWRTVPLITQPASYLTPEAPATPLESGSPSITLPAQSPSPSGAAPLGLAGVGGRPLTVDEFRHAWATDPAHLAGRIAITKGPIPTGFTCSGAGSADASASPGTCHLVAIEGQIAPEGYWAVKVYADGRLGLVGEVKMPGGSFIYKVSELRVIGPPAIGDIVVVYGWLRQDGLAGSPTGSADGLVAVQPETWASIAGPRATGPLEGFFLVQYGEPATVFAALEQLPVPQ
jgi:hypothetical protein